MQGYNINKFNILSNYSSTTKGSSLLDGNQILLQWENKFNIAGLAGHCLVADKAGSIKKEKLKYA
jgi:hypothetical protein